jgi:hypothetical protein
MYVFANPNPLRKYTGDCVIRGISILENMTWDETAMWLSVYMLLIKETPSDNDTWREFLFSRGYNKYLLPTNCPVCYTLRQFCEEHPNGRFLACTGSHVVAVIDGNYYDTWDSGDEIIAYYYRKDRD